MPSVEQSSTRMISFRNRHGLDALQDLADRVLLVVDRDHHRERPGRRGCGNAQLATEGFAELLDQPVPSFGIAGERHRARGPIGHGGLRIEMRRGDVHRAKIPWASPYPIGRLGVEASDRAVRSVTIR